MKIKIPNKQEIKNQTQEQKEEIYISEESGVTTNETSKETTEKTNKKININTATQEELETLTGIGTSTANKIIQYRKENGNFKTPEDLKNVSGIGEAKYNKIKQNITTK